MEHPTNVSSGDFSRLHVVTMYAGTEIPALSGPTRVVTNDPRSHATSGQSVKSGPVRVSHNTGFSPNLDNHRLALPLLLRWNGANATRGLARVSQILRDTGKI